jgi:hypothetical protein
LKKERIKKRIYTTRAIAKAEIDDYIETFYNRTRRHSHLSGVSPEMFEAVSNRAQRDDRFTVLADFANQAVRDNETGLVWERSPSSNTASWYDVVRACWLRQIGGRMGWHGISQPSKNCLPL